MASTKIPLELTAYAPDADGATLELQTTDTTVTDGSVLGKIEFKAPKEASGTDAILTAAAIEAVAEGTFAADNNATELVFKTGASEAATQKMVITSGGSVGIGTASPSRQLTVENTIANSGGVIGLTSSDSSTSGTCGIIHFGNSTDSSLASINGIADGATDAGALLFKTEATGAAIEERMRITSAGDLYFGQTSGSVNDTGTIIQANGRNFFMASTTSETIMHTYNNTSNSGAKYIISFRQNNTEVGSIEVGTSSTALVGSSDYRLKENIKTLSNGLDRVKKLKPVQFEWKKDGETSEGFLAHEIQEAGWNEGVTGEKDGERMQGVDYGRMTPLLVKAIQEQQTIIDDLKSRIKTLEEA